jgi:hypothetical protein
MLPLVRGNRSMQCYGCALTVSEAAFLCMQSRIDWQSEIVDLDGTTDIDLCPYTLVLRAAHSHLDSAFLYFWCGDARDSTREKQQEFREQRLAFLVWLRALPLTRNRWQAAEPELLLGAALPHGVVRIVRGYVTMSRAKSRPWRIAARARWA